MRYLIITDVHANLTALEAVLNTPEARGCDRVVSLGDQINYGPQPRQVMERLLSLGALLLRGNHEDRLDHLTEPAFRGYNWSLLHWSARQVEGLMPELPVETRIGSVLCTHAAPGDLYGLLYPPDLPAVLDALPSEVTHLLTGHNHISWRVEHRGRVAVNPGALGDWEMGRGGVAPFAVLDMAGERPDVTCHAVPYDTEALVRAYLASGCWREAPEMARIALTTMLHGGEGYALSMVRRISALCRERELDFGSREGWEQADRALPWPESVDSRTYWKKLERDGT